MIPLLSLLIIIPMAGSPLVYLLTKTNRNAGVTATLLLALVVLSIAVYTFWSVYAKIPDAGQYSFMASYQWVSTASFGVDFLLGIDGLSSPLILAAAIL
ncbi:MAG: dehydrogenase, partial [Nitrososphaerales archaeon]